MRRCTEQKKMTLYKRANLVQLVGHVNNPVHDTKSLALAKKFFDLLFVCVVYQQLVQYAAITFIQNYKMVNDITQWLK